MSLERYWEVDEVKRDGKMYLEGWACAAEYLHTDLARDGGRAFTLAKAAISNGKYADMKSAFQCGYRDAYLSAFGFDSDAPVHSVAHVYDDVEKCIACDHKDYMAEIALERRQ